MFSSSVGRVVRSTCSAPSSSAIGARASTPSVATVSRPVCHRTLQRRHSSSKPSCPSDGSKGPASSQQTPPSRTGRRKSKDAVTVIAPKGRDEAFVNLPSVPSTHHLHPSDVTLSSFFSLHRPISVTTSIPTPSTEASFNTIFEPRSQNNRKPADVIYTLGSVIDSIDAAARSKEERDLRWEILQESASNAEPTKHLDGAPQQLKLDQESLDKLLTQFRPFKAPPAPLPFDENKPTQPSRTRSSKQTVSETRSRQATQPKQKSWSATIVVTESTDADGAKTWSTSTSPLMQIPISRAQINEPAQPIKIRQPFLDRMRIRQVRWEDYREDRASGQEGQLFLISVKRQRKLKMKKHKYKKLMKRTRNLRRRLDRN